MWNDPELVRCVFYYYSQCIDTAVKNGYVRTVRFLLNREKKTLVELTFHYKVQILFESAAEHGHLEIIQLLAVVAAENSIVCNGANAIRAAAKNGFLNVIKHLVRKGACFYASDVCVAASHGGHVEVVQYVVGLSEYMSEYTARRCMAEAICNGHLNIVKYLVSLCIDPQEVLYYPSVGDALKEHVEIKQYLDTMEPVQCAR